MPRYRKIDVRIWNDRKFRELSDHGKLAFFLVLTHQDITPFGMLRARPVALAYELGWQPDAMSDAMSEVCRMGMVMMDEMAGLMVVPNFLKYNPPNGPNSLASWGELIEMMPECPLRDAHLCHVKAYLDNVSDGMKKGITDALRDAMSDAMRRASHIQEQEQEQEQKQDVLVTSRSASPRNAEPKKPKTTKPKLEKPDGVSDQVFDEWQALKRKLCKSCTQRMVDAIVREAEKADMTVEEAMTYQLEKGWKGFEAEWVHNAQPKNRPTDPQYGIGVCKPLPIEEVHWLTDEERAESRRQMELEGCAPF